MLSFFFNTYAQENKNLYKERVSMRLIGESNFYFTNKKTKKETRVTNEYLQTLGLEGKSIKANLKVVGDSLIVYPWTFTDESDAEKEEFFENNTVYLKMKERINYSFCYRSWNLNVITLPIKWYMSSDLGNAVTDINAMIMFGRSFGKSRYVKFPHEKDARAYKSIWSFNVLAGLSKIELNESNTKADNPVKGNIAAFSTGLSLGKHYNDFSFLLAVGYDLPTANSENWKFTGVPWFGLGFGYKLN